MRLTAPAINPYTTGRVVADAGASLRPHQIWRSDTGDFLVGSAVDKVAAHAARGDGVGDLVANGVDIERNRAGVIQGFWTTRHGSYNGWGRGGPVLDIAVASRSPLYAGTDQELVRRARELEGLAADSALTRRELREVLVRHGYDAWLVGSPDFHPSTIVALRPEITRVVVDPASAPPGRYSALYDAITGASLPKP